MNGDDGEVVVGQANLLALDQDDFAVALIHAVGQAHRCTGTVTFDRAFARSAGVDLPTA